MEGIKEYAGKIVIYIVLTSYVGVLFPNNSYRKYIRLVMGAVLVAVVLKPLEIFFA